MASMTAMKSDVTKTVMAGHGGNGDDDDDGD